MKIEVKNLPDQKGSGYPAPYDEPCKERRWKQLGQAAGLTQFGVARDAWNRSSTCNCTNSSHLTPTFFRREREDSGI